MENDSVSSHDFYPPAPLSQTVTLTQTPFPPLESDILYGRPRGRIATSALSSCAGTVKHTPDCTVSVMNFQIISGEGLTESVPRPLSISGSALDSGLALISRALRVLCSGFALNSPPTCICPNSVRNCFNRKLVTLLCVGISIYSNVSDLSSASYF